MNNSGLKQEAAEGSFDMSSPHRAPVDFTAPVFPPKPFSGKCLCTIGSKTVRFRNSISRIGVFLIAFVALLQGNTTHAEKPDDILIVVNLSVKATSITLADARRIFLKQKTSLKGQPIKPIHAKMSSELRKQFVQKVLGKTISEERSYWEDQKIKTGLRPPTELGNTLRAIFSTKNGISYCYRKDFSPNVAKILLVL